MTTTSTIALRERIAASIPPTAIASANLSSASSFGSSRESPTWTRGLAETQPEPAAILQGTVGAIFRRLAPDVAAPASGGTSNSNDVAVFVVEVRRDTTQLLTASLGEPHLRELRAQGATMNENQACTYARTHIDESLTGSAEGAR